MSYYSLIEKVKAHFVENLPFVLYSLPDSDTITALFQENTMLCKTDDFSSDSFVFAPFDYEEEAICIPKESSEVIEVNYISTSIDSHEIVLKKNKKKKDKYCQLVEKAKEAIHSGLNSKIVISRGESFPLKNFDLSILISRVLNLHKPAFRYVWFHPETGLWCGATPELLLKTDGTAFQTMALAGTQKYHEKIQPRWSEKEKQEQRIVTDSITTSLERVTSILKVSKTYNYKAASLVHLRTDFTGIFNKGKTTLSNITSVLHPTPAVSGSPKERAKQFILNNENYNREFYTGFLGPICGKENCSKLYVNLRCMKIEKENARLYVGGGITKDSINVEEWNETQNKLQTMLQVLQPML
ncbi:MAG: isochorismate synthase [Flavobacteriaceae bacterium]|nr:isochorismate synthase [Flavobacteriaceae bacterium]